MVRITIVRNEVDGTIYRMEVSGHSGYAAHGNDIVCAGVSSLAFTALNSLLELAQFTDEEIALNLQEGLMSLEVPEHSTDEQRYIASIVLETTRIGLETIADSFPKNIQIDTISSSDAVKATNWAQTTVRSGQVEEEQEYAPRINVNYARRVDY